MDCEQYQEQISQFIDNELSPTTETDLFVHLGVCEHCRTFLKNTLSLRNIFASAQQIAVPALLDQRVLDQNSPATKKAVNQNFIRRFLEAQYSFRTIGLAIIFSVLTSAIFSSFWYTSYQPKQTIVCLTPLPEVEVAGYVVIGHPPIKGHQQ